MSKRHMENFEEFEDTEDYDEYSLTLGRDLSDIKIKERPKRWSNSFILKIFLGIVAASILIYFLGSWLYFQFNLYMGM